MFIASHNSLNKSSILKRNLFADSVHSVSKIALNKCAVEQPEKNSLGNVHGVSAQMQKANFFLSVHGVSQIKKVVRSPNWYAFQMIFGSLS